MKLREWKYDDVPHISELYCNTVRNVNSKDYKDEQIEIWSAKQSDEFWIKRFDNYIVNIVEEQETIIGFSEYQYPGHIDCFYVHHEWQRKGAGSLLLKEIESQAKKENIKRLFVDVSTTAKPFFLAKEFLVVRPQNKTYKGIEFEQYFMEKWL